MRSKLILISFLCFATALSQDQSVSLYPSPPYKAGDVVEVCYTLSYDDTPSRYLEGFQINMSSEWKNLTPLTSPPDVFINSNGDWIWLDSATTFNEGTIGPGWFYEWVNSQDNNPLNDPGDWSGSYLPETSWEFCFTARLSNVCEHRILTMSVTVIDDNGYIHEPYTAYRGENDINLDSCRTYLYIPNAFTPNGDGLNDVVYVSGQAVTEMEWIIFDRWGTQVFISNSPLQGWDGSNCSAGVYSYVIQYTTTTNLYYRRMGHITLFR